MEYNLFQKLQFKLLWYICSLIYVKIGFMNQRSHTSQKFQATFEKQKPSHVLLSHVHTKLQ